MVAPNAITIKDLAWGRRLLWHRTGKVTADIYADTDAGSDQADDTVHTLELHDKTAHDNAIRGEDYPALVRVWDNDVDAAIYDTD